MLSNAPAPRVLLVEDDRTARDTLRTAIEAAGFRVTVAPNCLKLVAALAVDAPALVLIDARTSWCDSGALCDRLQQREGAPPVFLVGAAPSEEERLQRLGARAVLPGPLDTSALTLHLRAVLGAR